MIAIIGILLIVAGVLAILFMPDSKKSTTADTDGDSSSKSTGADTEKSEEEQK